MTIKQFLKVDGVTDADDLPWANVWKKTVEDYAEPRPIWTVDVYGTGLMIKCKEYRGYIHEGTKLHDYLLEALTVYHKEKTSEDLLMVKVNKKGKIEIVVEDEVKCRRWLRNEDRFVQVMNGENLKSEEKEVNPFLAGRGVPNARTAGEGEEGNSESNGTTAGARKPKKGVSTAE